MTFYNYWGGSGNITTVLIVEDEAITAIDLRFNLEDLGYEIIAVVDNGEDAVTIAAEQNPDITIMDIKKITREEAIRRWKHSLEIKHEWERKVAERWANEDQQKVAIVW